MRKATWTKPELVSLAGGSDSENGKYKLVNEVTNFGPSGTQDPV